MIDESAQPLWQVVGNDTGRYSIWPAAGSVPDGWRGAGVTAPKPDCLAWIGTQWTDERLAGVGRERR